MVIKSVRGLLVDGGQDKIRLTTTDGLMGYRIVKFQGIGPEPGETVMESTLKIYKIEQTTINNAINFTDSDLLAAAYITDNASRQLDVNSAVIFDNEIFNQDIYITHEDTTGNVACNYYIELEQIKLTVIQAELLIVKSLRGEVWTRP